MESWTFEVYGQTFAKKNRQVAIRRNGREYRIYGEEARQEVRDALMQIPPEIRRLGLIHPDITMVFEVPDAVAQELAATGDPVRAIDAGLTTAADARHAAVSVVKDAVHTAVADIREASRPAARTDARRVTQTDSAATSLAKAATDRTPMVHTTRATATRPTRAQSSVSHSVGNAAAKVVSEAITSPPNRAIMLPLGSRHAVDLMTLLICYFPGCCRRRFMPSRPECCESARDGISRIAPIRISPEVTASSPAIMRRVVVLPQPEGPTNTTNSLSWMCRSTSFTTWLVSNILLSLRTITSAMTPVPCPIP